jgi:hypothetical protein
MPNTCTGAKKRTSQPVEDPLLPGYMEQPLELDLNLNARRQLKPHQGIDG